MKIKIMLALSNILFAEGVSKILEKDNGISTAILAPGTKVSPEDLESSNPDLIITDYETLNNAFPEIENSARKINFILLDTNNLRDSLASTILKKGINGVLLCDSNPSLLKKAVKTVSRGEVWMDRRIFKSLLSKMTAGSSDKNHVLSERDRKIVSLIGHGLRNKEIAQRLNISEATVKSQLNRIIQKLNVRSRSDLIRYAIKHGELSILSSGEP